MKHVAGAGFLTYTVIPPRPEAQLRHLRPAFQRLLDPQPRALQHRRQDRPRHLRFLQLGPMSSKAATMKQLQMGELSAMHMGMQQLVRLIDVKISATTLRAGRTPILGWNTMVNVIVAIP